MTNYIENLVLIPGMNGTKQVWDKVIDHLPKSINYYPVTSPAISDLEGIAESLLEELPEKFHLAGYSFGGNVALAILDLAPERVTGLSLIGTNIDTFTDVAKVNQQEKIRKAKSGEYEKMTRASAIASTHPKHVNNTEILEIQENMMQDYGVDRYAAHATATMNRVDRKHLLSTVNIPYLFVASEEDKIVPIEKLETLSQIPAQAYFKTIKDAGHTMPLEQPKDLADQMLEWLKSV